MTAREERWDKFGMEPWVDMFCKLYALNGNGVSSYLEARRSFTGKAPSISTCQSKSMKLLNLDAVRQQVQKYRREASMSTSEIRDTILSHVPMTINELVHIITIDWERDDNGNVRYDSDGHIVRRHISATVLREKLNAIKTLLGMAGFSEIKKIELSQAEKLELILSKCDQDELERISSTGELPDFIRNRLENFELSEELT